MNYVVMDTSSIVLWVSVCIRNMNVYLALAAFLKELSSSM